MKTLELFNAVLAKEPTVGSNLFNTELGLVIEAEATWAGKEIIAFYEKERLNGNDLNKTFHKSWAKIKNSSRFELLLDQIRHYLSTYGSGFSAEIYIPQEILDIPDTKLTLKVIKAYTKEQMTQKCLNLLRSGIALKEDTIDDVLYVLTNDLDYVFTGKEGIRNKEAIIKIADLYGVLPTDTMEFLRYVIYRSTNATLLIKNKEVIGAIKASKFNPGPAFNQFGLDRLAEVFNRFKPLFLAYKDKCPKVINKISKLSKKLHKPLVVNPLNQVTTVPLSVLDNKWLDNATPYAIFKAMAALHSRINNQTAFVYRIRNGKSWVTVNEGVQDRLVWNQNIRFLSRYLKNNYPMDGVKIYIPEGVDYALPTSEKMYVGNIPTGTKFSGNKLAVGMYWEDSWGARDLDLSGINVSGKVGWNSSYNQGRGNLMYSGDITSAPNGAVEYLYANDGLYDPTIVQINVYNGSNDAGYRIIVGKGDKVNKNYMMNPDNLFGQVKVEAVQKQMVLGIIIPETLGNQSFVLLNYGAGEARISGRGINTEVATRALFEQWSNPLSFNEMVQYLGAEIVTDREEANVDLSIEALERDTFVELFEKRPALVV